MFDHVTIRVADLEASRRFYGTLLDTLGHALTADSEFGPEWDDFSMAVADAEHPVTSGLHVGFSARSRAEVDAAWQAAIDLGAPDDGAPGPRPEYREDYYGGFVRDPDGNSAEAVHHGARRDDGVVDHVWMRVADLDASRAFYATVARVAGHQVVEEEPGHVLVRGASGSLSLIAGAPATRGVHIAFPADDDATVDAFHAVVTAAGHPSNGAPGERPEYHAGYYAAFVLDPDGNNIELVNHHR